MTEIYLGIEWFENYLKLACLEKEGQKYRLWRLEMLPVEAFSDWVAQHLPANCRVHTTVALPESLIFLKELVLPKLKGKSLDEAVFWEISSVAPLPASEAVIQWQKIAEEEKQISLAVIVVRNELVKKITTIFQKTSIQPTAIEPASLAFVRLAQTDFKKTLLWISAEKTETNFVILKNGRPVFSNSITIPLESARTKKRKLAPKLAKNLAANAKKVISFWEAKEKSRVKQVVIAGDGLSFSGLATAINQQTHLPAVFGKRKTLPAKILFDQPKATQRRFLVPLAAALRPILEKQAEGVNLLPQAEKKILDKKQTEFLLKKNVFLLAVVTLVLALATVFFLTAVRFWHLALNKQVEQKKLLVEAHQAQGLIAEVEKTNRLLGQINQLFAVQKDTGKRLRQIAQLIPAGIRLTAVEENELEKETWRLAGVGSREEILAFFEKVKAEAGASRVTMPYSNLKQVKGAEFELTIKW